MRVREDSIRYRDGSTGIYGVVEKPNFVVIVAREADGRIHLVQQFRYPVAGRYWELPQGAWELRPEADPLEVTQAFPLAEIERMIRDGEIKDATAVAAPGLPRFKGLL